MTRCDHDYYVKRAAQEDAAAANASCEAARECHEELADAYRRRCAVILASGEVGSPVTVVDHPTTIRQPTVMSSTAALSASPPAAASPLCRA